MKYQLFIIGILAASLVGCGSTTGGPGSAGSQSGQTPTSTNTSNHSNSSNTPRPTSRAIAYLAGQPIRPEQLHAALYEASGGEILREHILDTEIRKRLSKAGKLVTDTLIQQERQILLSTLSPDPNQATRLLNELRRRRGLGGTRYTTLLRRNAGLRILVQGDVAISDQRVEQAFQMKYGPSYQTRLIMLDNVAQAASIVRQARAGTATFADLAVEHSTDRSRGAGGLLPAINPADQTWPDGIRETVGKMEVGDVSEPIALQKGFAVLKLEKKIPAQSVRLDDVKPELQKVVRRTVESSLMQKLAGRVLNEADVLVVNPALKDSWDANQGETSNK